MNTCHVGMVQGRTHGLRKRLKDLAEFVFVDAPHRLPAWSKAAAAEGTGEAGVSGAAVPQRQEQLEQQQKEQPTAAQQQRGAPARRAWMLTPEQLATQQQGNGEELAAAAAAAAAAGLTDEWQFQQQTAGWQDSEQALAAVLREKGPFDGVLGFSQGAAVAAVLAAQQWQQQTEKRLGQAGSGADSCIETAAAASPSQLQFAILCSGYRSPLPEHRQLLETAAAAGGVALPSLHIYGAGG